MSIVNFGVNRRHKLFDPWSSFALYSYSLREENQNIKGVIKVKNCEKCASSLTGTIPTAEKEQVPKQAGDSW